MYYNVKEILFNIDLTMQRGARQQIMTKWLRLVAISQCSRIMKKLT